MTRSSEFCRLRLLLRCGALLLNGWCCCFVADDAASKRIVTRAKCADNRALLPCSESKAGAEIVMHVYTEGNAEWVSNWWAARAAKGRSGGMSGPSKGVPGCTLKMHSDESLSKTLDGFVSADVLGLGFSTLSGSAAMVEPCQIQSVSVFYPVESLTALWCGTSLLIQSNAPS